MQLSRQELINELVEICNQATETVLVFKSLTLDQLNFRKSEHEWSILECIEHLNLYGDFYLPEIESSLMLQHQAPDARLYKPGIIGNYFARLMKVNNGKVKKMKSPKDKDPIHSELSITTLDRFIKQQDLLSHLLFKALKADLTKTKTAISLTKMIRLRLGDTLRFYVYHIERHIKQASAIKTHLKNIASDRKAA